MPIVLANTDEKKKKKKMRLLKTFSRGFVAGVLYLVVLVALITS